MTKDPDQTTHPVLALAWEYLCDEIITCHLPLRERLSFIATELVTRHPELMNPLHDKMAIKSKRSEAALAKRAILTKVTDHACVYRIEEVR